MGIADVKFGARDAKEKNKVALNEVTAYPSREKLSCE